MREALSLEGSLYDQGVGEGSTSIVAARRRYVKNKRRWT